MPHNMQISDNAIIDWLVWVVGAAVTGFIAMLTYIWKGDRKRLKEIEDKMANSITKPEVDVIVARVEADFHADHRGLEGKMERIESSLRKEIHESHDSLQNGIDKVVNILLTRDENDRRRRDE